MEGGGRRGFMAVLRAWAMIRGKTAIAMGLALPINLGMVGVEALFNYRIITPCIDRGIWGVVVVVGLEGVLIAYIYSILILLDVIMSFFFYQACRSNDFSLLLRSEDYYYYYDDDDDVQKVKGMKEFV